MTPEQFDTFLERNERSTREAIERTVNGKIDGIRTLVVEHNTRHEKDMEEVREHIAATKPVLEAYRGAGLVGSFIKWAGGIILTVAAVWALFIKQ